MRVQLALNVKDLERAVDYYEKLFDAKVAKRRPGYANFAIDAPPLKLVLFENPEAEERLNHLGVEVFESEAVDAASERISRHALPHRVIKDERCCWAEKNTVYSEDPEGLMWEYYEVTGDIEAPPEALASPEAKPTSPSGCCS